MKRVILVAFCVCGLLGLGLARVAGSRQSSAQSGVPIKKLVIALRLLNTEEASYLEANHRFANREQLLAFLRQEGSLSKAPIDLENPRPYDLAITTTSDGMHYQITLQKPSDVNDQRTWCSTAAFSDDRGVIFLGQAIGCTTTSAAY
jgi:hypothetical protein